MEKFADYFKKWRLQPSLSKTVSSVYRLHNTKSNQTLKLLLSDLTIRYEPNPVYLAVTLDHTLSFHEHLRKTTAKVSTRNNLLWMLAGSSWVHLPNTQNVSVSSVLFCSRVLRSCLVKISLHQLNEAMRTVSGTLIYPTPMVTGT